MAEHVTVFPSLARTASSTVDLVNDEGANSLVVVIDVTAASDSPSVVFSVRGYDPASNKDYVILDSAAITGTGTTVLRVAPELTAAANTIAKDILPRHWRIVATHADADSITYSVGASMI